MLEHQSVLFARISRTGRRPVSRLSFETRPIQDFTVIALESSGNSINPGDRRRIFQQARMTDIE
jgi:hypothetical protein